MFAFVGSGGGVVRETVQAEAGLLPRRRPPPARGRPRSVGGELVPHADRPIKAGWARILVAATASLVPADVRVDDRVVFANIANGESATIDVTAGRHLVALVPTGQPAPAVLGPLKVTVAAGTVTMVYAAGGSPAGALRTIVHTMALGNGGGAAPGRVHTGTVGMARDLPVRVFGPG